MKRLLSQFGLKYTWDLYFFPNSLSGLFALWANATESLNIDTARKYIELICYCVHMTIIVGATDKIECNTGSSFPLELLLKATIPQT